MSASDAAREHHQRECWCGINHEYERRIADHGTNAPAVARVPDPVTPPTIPPPKPDDALRSVLPAGSAARGRN